MRSQRRRAWELLGQTETPDGSDIRLTVRDDKYVILVNGDTLMSSRTHGSEEALATVACRRVQSAERPRVLVGGLGMGFTLRAGSAPAGRDRDGRGTCGRSGRVEPRAARGTCRTPAE